ncbi:sodium:proton antiporter [Arcobacter suis]|nr:sodium:proton antiporter [Arcobacter suis]
MIRYFLIFILLKSILFGCSLCSIYTPRTHVSTQIKADKEYIKTLKVNWVFANEFTKELLQIYDKNLDSSFDEKELVLIQTALIDYLKPKNFITSISYDKQINEESNAFEIKDYKMSYKNSTLSFEYNIDLNYKIYDKNILYIKIIDDENYFDIVFEDKKQLMYIPYKISKTSNMNDVSFLIDAPTLLSNEDNFNEEKTSLDVKKVEKKIENKEEKIVENSQTILEKFTNNIKKYLIDIQKGDNVALAFLLMASFIYGVIHAFGPGHGKALAFSYFSAQKSSYFEAFIISLVTAFIHILGALFIVLFSVFILQSVMNRFMEDSISYITSFSAVIIMFLALYILYRKLSKKSCSCNVKLQTTTFSTIPTNINFVKTTLNKPIISKKRSKKQDLIFVLTAGIIPCPGTVLLFVYAFFLKTYFAVFLASISISLGMAFVLFVSSFLGVSLNKTTQKSAKLINILEIVSPIFMFILGLLLLLNANKV